MIIPLGAILTGSVKKFKGTKIKTQFIIVGIPICPTGESLLVTDSTWNKVTGISIKMNTMSIVAAYTRALMFIYTICYYLLYTDSLFNVKFDSLIALTLASWFLLGRAGKKEREIRTIIGESIGLYAMPNWLTFDSALKFYDFSRKAYEAKSPDWQADLRRGQVHDAKLAYAVALLYVEFDYYSGESIELRDIAAELYAHKELLLKS